jgi:hypothetical protein
LGCSFFLAELLFFSGALRALGERPIEIAQTLPQAILATPAANKFGKLTNTCEGQFAILLSPSAFCADLTPKFNRH